MSSPTLKILHIVRRVAVSQASIWSASPTGSTAGRIELSFVEGMPAAQIGMDNGLLTKKKTNGAFTWAANSSLKQNEFSFYSAGKMMRYIRSEAGTNGDRFRLITVMALFVPSLELLLLGLSSWDLRPA